jgi:hypothetical protein
LGCTHFWHIDSRRTAHWQRIADAYGLPITTPYPELSRLFPTPSALAQATPDALGELGEGQGKELVQAVEILDFVIALMDCDAAARGACWQMSHKLREHELAWCIAV